MDGERRCRTEVNLVLGATTEQITCVPHLLSDITTEHLVKEPFPHFVRTQAVPTTVYEQLAVGFPSLETIVGGGGNVGSNVAVRVSSKEVLNDHRIPYLWREFFVYYTSAAYWREVVRVFARDFRREFPGLEDRVGRAYEDWRVAPRGCDGAAEVRLDCQFVMNTPVVKSSSVKTPHVDLCNKIFSALLYFRDPADISAGGDLDLYRWRRNPRFVKHRVWERDVDRVQTVKYAANTYICFVNSESAVHGVSPRGVTSIPRRYINFIAELPVKAFKPKQLSKFHRLLFHHER